MSRAPKIAIIGGGIGGFATATALHRRGIEVHVHERNPELREIGAGLQLSPNALKVLRALELEAKTLALGFQTENQVVRKWHNGRVISSGRRKGVFDSLFGAPHCCIHRADLRDILSEGVPERFVHLAADCVSVETDGGTARAKFADGAEIEADAIIGADGIHSRVRTSLFGPESPRFTGIMCWRGMVAAADLPREVQSADGNAWIGPHGHVVQYNIRSGELVNFVAHLDADKWTEESWSSEGEVSELLAAYEGWDRNVLRLFASCEHVYKWALYDRDPLDHWTQGRVTLLGDSAHAMLPYLGQGACMAIEDGYVLAAAIDGMRDDIPAALLHYEQIRLPRTTQAQLGSRARGAENHLTSRWAQLKRDVRLVLRRLFTSDGTPRKVAWLYGYDATRDPRLHPSFETILRDSAG